MRGRLTVDELRQDIASGGIDTLLMVFPDLQGRWMGKRVTGHYVVDHVLDGGGTIEACNYLLAVDADMNVLPGYRFASWDLGYGDFTLAADWSTLRPVPWIERTALVICDLLDEEHHQPVEVAPRQILRRQVERAAQAGYVTKFGSELEFFLFRDSYEEAAANGYRDLTPQNNYVLDYHILQTTKDEYLIRQIRNGMDDAGVPVEFSKGEAEAGQHEINLRYADAMEMADRHSVYKNGAKEIAALNGQAITFMAKYDITKTGSSCHIHSSVWDGAGERSLMWDEAGPHQMSEVFRWWLGGQLAAAGELALCFAPYVNSYKRFQPDSWAPTALSWGRDNRTLGYRVVGHGQGYRVECRVPGADANAYIAFAATIAAGLWGIENQIEPGPPYAGNGYTAEELPRVPHSLVDAIASFESSTLAVDAFGPDVHHHLLNTARQEWIHFNNYVTDWERRRGFEQL
jgi:glutamine synthetase